MSIRCEIALTWRPQDRIGGDKPTLVWVMAWRRQETISCPLLGVIRAIGFTIPASKLGTDE